MKVWDPTCIKFTSPFQHVNVYKELQKLALAYMIRLHTLETRNIFKNDIQLHFNCGIRFRPIFIAFCYTGSSKLGKYN